MYFYIDPIFISNFNHQKYTHATTYHFFHHFPTIAFICFVFASFLAITIIPSL